MVYEVDKKQSQRFLEEDPVGKFKKFSNLYSLKMRLEKKSSSEVKGSLMVGYYDGNYVYLVPPPNWNTVNRFCIYEGSHFPLSKAAYYTILCLAPYNRTEPHPKAVPRKLEISDVFKYFFTYSSGVLLSSAEWGVNPL